MAKTKKRKGNKGNLYVGLSLTTGIIGFLIAGPILGPIAIWLGNNGIKKNRTPTLGKIGIFLGILNIFYYIAFIVGVITWNLILGLVIAIIGTIIGIIVLIRLLMKKNNKK